MSPPPRPTRRWSALAVLGLGPATVVLSLVFGFDPVAWEAQRPLTHRADGFTGSTACLACHPKHHASWKRTFHRTMTQRATAESVQGEFDGRTVAYEGRSARPYRRDGGYWMEIDPSPDGKRAKRTAEVVLTVGSRRYQQYFEREQRDDGFAFVRLPILWHIEQRRWLHLNTVFLGPDNPDWDRHRSRWNDNCIFCHNTAPKPLEIEPFSDPSAERRFDSKVAELGIACETCHGPGAAHVELYDDPTRRYRDYLSHDNDPLIVNPEELDKERSISLCGQCHGQRMPPDLSHLGTWLTEGPTFRSGERLRDHVRSVTRETPSPAEERPELFSLRFWNDGTPRLTAYEYQGVAMSACYLKGEMTCDSCHTMHGGDPRGMIRPPKRGNRACLPCHTDIAADVGAHTLHDPGGSGSACMTCHMPRMVYGVLEIHRSHRIENPSPKRDGEAGRPHACTTCHLDKTLLWSAEEMTRMWGKPYDPPASRPDGAPLELPDFAASLLSGDAVQRAVYAWAGGRPDADLKPEEKAAVRAALTATLADGYPSVRSLALRSLLSLERELPLGLEPALAAWDHTDAATRVDFARRIFDETARLAPGRLNPAPAGSLLRGDFTPDLDRIVPLLDLQSDRVIEIGE